jgi:hypothetical protein
MLDQIKINQFDYLVIRRLYNVDKKPEWFYQSKIKGHCPQYSNAFIKYLVNKVRQDKNFFKRAR